MQVEIVDAGGRPLMTVVPEWSQLDLQKVAATVGVETARIAEERIWRRIFRDCEAGAIPPFGNLYGLPIYVDAAFVRAEDVAFPPGNHQYLVTMKYQDFSRLARPVLADLVVGTAGTL